MNELKARIRYTSIGAKAQYVAAKFLSWVYVRLSFFIHADNIGEYKVLRDSSQLTETHYVETTKTREETTTLEELISKLFSKGLLDSYVISEQCEKRVIRSRAEAVGHAETYSKQVNKQRGEQYSLAELIFRQSIKALSDQISTDETLEKQVERTLSQETLNTTETSYKQLTRYLNDQYSWDESLNTESSQFRQVTESYATSEQLTFTGSRQLQDTYNSQESLTVILEGYVEPGYVEFGYVGTFQSLQG